MSYDANEEVDSQHPLDERLNLSILGFKMKSLQQHAGCERGTFPGLHGAVSCSHKVVLPVSASLTLTFSSGLCEFLFPCLALNFYNRCKFTETSSRHWCIGLYPGLR